MTIPVLLSLAVSTAIGTLLSFALVPAPERRPAGILFRIAAGAVLGTGLTSCLCFLCLLAGMPRAVFVVEAAAVLALAALVFFVFRKNRLKNGPGEAEPAGRFKFRWALPALFCGALLASAASFVMATLREPHGKWDAWWIWNFHARFIYRSGEAWRGMFTEALDWTHLDYPLLVPLSVVRSWQYAGSETLQGPVLLAGLFTFAAAGAVWAALALLRGRSQGFLGGLVLMGTPFFVVLGAAQFADIPLALFFLLSFVFVFLHDRDAAGGNGLLVLAGLAAGLAAWTKNEGLLFFILFVLARLVLTAFSGGGKEAARQLLWIAAGAAPVLAVVAVFKVNLALSSHLFAGQTFQQIMPRLFDPHRYYEILKAYVLTGLSFTQGFADIRTGIHFNPGLVNVILLAAYLALIGVRIDGRDRLNLQAGAAVLVLMLAGYFAIHLVAPYELNYHLMTSLNRLYMQLWPSAVFLFFMAARTPEQALAGGAATPVKERLIREKHRKKGRRP